MPGAAGLQALEAGPESLARPQRPCALPSIRCSAVSVHGAEQQDEQAEEHRTHFDTKAHQDHARPRLEARAHSEPEQGDEQAPLVGAGQQAGKLEVPGESAGAKLTRSPSASWRARNLLSAALSSLAPQRAGQASQLRPAASASCIFVPAPASPSAEQAPNSGSACQLQQEAPALAAIPTRASLTHRWRKLRTPSKCRECHLLVYFSGRECADCAFVAHKKCALALVVRCARLLGPAAPSARPIFGQALAGDEAQAQQVLQFVRRFIGEIEARGLAARGLYRVSSIKSKVDRLCQYFDQNPSSLIDLSSFHPNIIANALKIYLRQLPEPLLTHALYQQFIAIAKRHHHHQHSHQQQQQQRRRSCAGSATPQEQHKHSRADGQLLVDIRQTLDCLPPINRRLAGLLVRHLSRVAQMSELNQMSAKNLSIIFGPTLLNLEQRHKSLAIVDNIHQARLVELMIQSAHELFPDSQQFELEQQVVAIIEPDHSSHVSC